MHRAQKLFLSVYVDDFKMAGLKTNLPSMWKTLGEKLELEPAVPLHGNVYLGCGQHDEAVPAGLVEDKQKLYSRLFADHHNNVRGETSSSALQSASLPTTRQNKFAKDHPKQPKIKTYAYDMKGHAGQCVERYLELANLHESSLKPVGTPCIDDHMIPPEDFETKGSLSPIAARVVLKCLFLARVLRVDLMWTVNALARNVTKWNVACDKRLHRLIAYIHNTDSWKLYCFVGDHPKDCKIVQFSDASFGADLVDSKSTTGAFLCLVGPNTFVPLTWVCKKQGAISHSSSEAEIIALEAGVRMEGIPRLVLWREIICLLRRGISSIAKTTTNAYNRGRSNKR